MNHTEAQSLAQVNSSTILDPVGSNQFMSVQGTLKSLLQHHSSKASILKCLAFFMVQLSPPVHDYWKNYNSEYMDLFSLSDVSAFKYTV